MLHVLLREAVGARIIQKQLKCPLLLSASALLCAGKGPLRYDIAVTLRS